MSDKHSQLANLLLQVEKSLRELSLWADHQPAPEALASTQPFAVDTLPFQEWLQFIFLPRMGHLIEQGAQLPNNCNIAPMAEELFSQAGYYEMQLIQQLEEIDHILGTE